MKSATPTTETTMNEATQKEIARTLKNLLNANGYQPTGEVELYGDNEVIVYADRNLDRADGMPGKAERKLKRLKAPGQFLMGSVINGNGLAIRIK